MRFAMSNALHCNSAFESEPFDPESVEFDESTVDFDPDAVPFDPDSVEFDPSTVEFDRGAATTWLDAAKAKGSAAAQETAPPELTDAIMGESIMSAPTMAELYRRRDVAYPTEVYAEAGAAPEGLR